MATTTKRKRDDKRDTTDRDPMWCLVTCAGPQLHAEALSTQCAHKNASGQYVVHIDGKGWCFFDPPTRLQALAWVHNRPEREKRIHWLCRECGQIMPLASYGHTKESAHETCPDCINAAKESK